MFAGETLEVCRSRMGQEALSHSCVWDLYIGGCWSGGLCLWLLQSWILAVSLLGGGIRSLQKLLPRWALKSEPTNFIHMLFI